MYCSKCGKESNDGAAFCPACGTPCSTHQHKKKSTILKIVISVTAVILALVVLILVLPKLIPTNTPKAPEDKDVVINESSEPVDNESSEIVNNESSESVNYESSEAVENTSAAYDALLANLEEAYTAVETAVTQVSNINSDDANEGMKQRITIYGELQQTLSNLQTQSISLAANDDKLNDAVLSYYSMTTSYAKIYFDFFDFFNRYNNGTFILKRPDLTDDSKTPDENYEAMVNWYESAKNEYANFEYPSFVEAYWKGYENILNLNQSIIKKYVFAYYLNDPLRYMSCAELYVRCKTAEEKWFNDLLDSSCDILDSYSGSCYTFSVNLYNEIQDYIGMAEKEKEEYVFDYNMLNRIYYDTECVDTIYPSLYNTYDSFVIINLATYGGQRKIDVEVEIPGFTQKYRQSYTITSTARQLFIKPPILTGDIDLTSAKSAQINITFYEQDGTQVITESHPVTIKSKNDFEWSSSDFGIFTKDNILCFLTPESSDIASLKRSAIDEITQMTGGAIDCFPGYQEVGYNHYAITYYQAAALMRAMYNSGVRYNMDVFSVSGSNQHILLPDQVLEQQSGLCIETSLVIASALQSAGMHAFLVLPPGHAQVAVEIWDGVEDEGCGEYFLIETTALSDDIINGSAFTDYANALCKGKLDATNKSCIEYYNNAKWKNYLQNAYVIDCNDSGILGMTPFSN